MNGEVHSDFCNTSEGRIKYYRQGSGEPILLIHGITTYSFIWRNIAKELSKNFEVLTIDLLGCGESDKPLNVLYSIKHHSEIIKEFIDNLNLTQVHLVTHDVGGGIGQIMAVNYPNLLKSLVLINSVGYDFWPVQPIITMRTPIIRQLAMATLDFGTFKLIVRRGLYNKENLTPELMEYFWKPMKTKEGRRSFLHFAKCLNNKDLLELKSEFKNVEIPVLVVRGEADIYLSGEISEQLVKDFKNANLLKIKTGGHFIQEDVPELLSEHIKLFIEENEQNIYRN